MSPEPTAGSTFVVRADGDVQRAVMRVGRSADALGFDAHARCAIQTALAELGTNILKYAGEGRLRLTPLGEPRPGIELEAFDQGPGIPDVEIALSDSYSTSGTLGMGLPGIRRLMDEFAITSHPGAGTVVTVRKWLR